jgi:hypothetical protein
VLQQIVLFRKWPAVILHREKKEESLRFVLENQQESWAEELPAGDRRNWLQIFANFKMNIQNTGKVSKYEIQQKYQDMVKLLRFSLEFAKFGAKIFQFLTF